MPFLNKERTMGMKIVLASNNKHKLEEYKKILSPLGFEVISQSEAGVDIEVEETGTTFEENALLKAKAVHEACALPVFADDSGLEVDFLGGRPGIYSARYAGKDATDRERCEKILEELKGVEPSKRTARFVCVIQYIDKNGNAKTARGKCNGIIGETMSGKGGFGYDPIFVFEGKSFAEMGPEEKNRVSHRARAVQKFLEILKEGK